jgi:hypothetical protein
MSPLITTKAGASANAYGWGAASAAATSYQSINTVTAAGGETSLSLSSIPSTFTHLQIRGIARDTFTGTNVRSLLMRFNSDTGTNYARHQLYGNGSAATVGGADTTTFMNLWACAPADGMTASTYGAFLLDVLDYASTTKYKTMRGFTGADVNGTGSVNLVSGLWMSTSALTSLTFIAEATAFKAGTTFALYGIKAAA